MNSDDGGLRSVVDHHTLQGEFGLSGGGTSGIYIDMRSALLCWRCAVPLVAWYEEALERSVTEEYKAVPVATGTFGALLLGWLGAWDWGGILWNPKGHGVEWSWSGHKPLNAIRRVALLDDVVTTGGTLRALRAACERQGWEVVAEIVAVRRGDAS